jgi:integrase
MSKPLTDSEVQRLEPRLTAYKVSDSGTPGLYLLVGASGSKTWRFRYQKDRREHTITLGRYQPKAKPEHHMTLANARAAAWELKGELQAGGHPAERINEPASITFKEAAEDYLKYFARNGGRDNGPAAPATLANTRRVFENCKALYRKPIKTIRPAEYQAVIDARVDAGKYEDASKTRSFLNKVCRHAIAFDWLDKNPIPNLPTPPKATAANRVAITSPKQLGKLLRLIDTYEGAESIRAYLQILPHVFVRPGELRLARWGEFNFKKRTWTIPAERMKSRKADHVVPLSKQVVGLLLDHEIEDFDHDKKSYVFRSKTHRKRPISNNTPNYALRQLGIDTRKVHCAHGFRTTASTLLNEAGFDRDVIEVCLGHGDEDRIRAIYNRSQRRKARAELMQSWSDMLDRMKAKK